MKFLANLQRAIDWWVTPRWRALLTWVALSGGPHLLLTTPAKELFGLMDLAAVQLEDLFPFLNASALWSVWTFVLMSLLSAWYQPIILRLPPLRILVWIGLAVLSALVVTVTFNRTASQGLVTSVLFLALLSVLPVIAMIGCRSRPWMALVSAALGAGAGLPLVGSDWTPSLEPALRHAIAESIFAAVLIYGTSPLPRNAPRVEPVESV